MNKGSTTHGMHRSVEYRAWYHMKARCFNTSNADYKNYGARGIIVCDRWLEFGLFYEDMGDRPSARYSIDRKDNDGNYEPSNCRWATRIQQSRNRRVCKTNASGVNGVQRAGYKWRSRIRVNGKNVNLGTFTTIAEAAKARLLGEQKYWPESV